MKSLRSSLLFSAGTFISRIFGLIRESVIAGTFGASISMDAFIIANRIPNMLREMFAEGALGSSFTKVYSELSEKNEKRAHGLFSNMIVFFFIVSIVIVFLGIYFSPYLVDSLTLISDERAKESFRQQTIGLTKLLFPFIGMMILSSIASGVLHQKGKFFFSSISPIALNIGYLIGALVLSPILVTYGPNWIETTIADKAITGLAIGVLIGGFLQCFIQFVSIRTVFKELNHIKIKNLLSDDVKKVLLLMGPMIIASSAGQINIFINTNFATSLETGAVSWLTFSFRLLQLPIGIFAIAVSSVALPRFTKLFANKAESKKISQEFFHMNEFMLWLMLPCVVFFQFNSYSVIHLLFGHGSFTSFDILKTSESLYYYSFGLIGYGLIKVLTSFYYALEKTKFAMKISLLGIVINYFLNYILVEKYGFKGLAMSSSILLSVNALGLVIGLVKEKIALPGVDLLKGVTLLLSACALACLFQIISDQYLPQYLGSHLNPTKMSSLLYILINGVVIVASFFVFGWYRIRKIY